MNFIPGHRSVLFSVSVKDISLIWPGEKGCSWWLRRQQTEVGIRRANPCFFLRTLLIPKSQPSMNSLAPSCCLIYLVNTAVGITCKQGRRAVWKSAESPWLWLRAGIFSCYMERVITVVKQRSGLLQYRSLSFRSSPQIYFAAVWLKMILIPPISTTSAC